MFQLFGILTSHRSGSGMVWRFGCAVQAVFSLQAAGSCRGKKMAAFFAQWNYMTNFGF